MQRITRHEQQSHAVLAAVLGIMVAAFAVYYGTLAAPLIYDDRFWITWNPSIQHLRALGAVLSAPADSIVRGRPVLSLSLALNYALSGNDAWSYHLVNLWIHILAALTLFGIVRRTLAFRPRFFPEERDRVLPAFAVALLWTVHPLQTEAVTYVIQRAESLMGLFYLLTLYCFIRGVQAPRVVAWPLLSVLVCFLGMATKEVMVTAPLIVLAYDRTFVAGGFGKALRLRWLYYLDLAATWIVLGFLSVGLGARGVGYGLGYSWWTYGVTECWVVVHYVLLSLFPYPLVLDYGTDLVGTVRDVLPWACVLVVLLGVTLIAFMRRTLAGFAGVWFFLILAPTSSIIPVAYQPMAEHRMYLPLAAVAALGVAGAWSLLGRRSLPVILAAALALGILAGLRNRDYRSEVSIWTDTVMRRPSNARAHLALGSAFAAEERDSEAASQFAEAVHVDPGDSEAHRKLGLALYHLGRTEEALAQYKLIVTQPPDSAEFHYDYAMALDRAGRTAEAIVEYSRALKLDPGDGEARNNLGNALFRSGRVDDAIAQYQLALKTESRAARVHFNMAMALAEKGDFEKAIGEDREAVRLDPVNAETHNSLGYLLSEVGRMVDAKAEYETALRLKPDYAMARANLEELKALQAASTRPL